MTREEAERLLALAREATFTGPDARVWLERLAPKRSEFIEAARFLSSNGTGEAAAELAAGVWRLGLLSGDGAGGGGEVAPPPGIWWHPPPPPPPPPPAAGRLPAPPACA